MVSDMQTLSVDWIGPDGEQYKVDIDVTLIGDGKVFKIGANGKYGELDVDDVKITNGLDPKGEGFSLHVGGRPNKR